VGGKPSEFLVQLETDSPFRGERLRFPGADNHEAQLAKEAGGARLRCRLLPYFELGAAGRLVRRSGEGRLELGCVSRPQPVKARRRS
jgi:hypothetical protein